jgi:hypothetical protein
MKKIGYLYSEWHYLELIFINEIREERHNSNQIFKRKYICSPSSQKLVPITVSRNIANTGEIIGTPRGI